MARHKNVNTSGLRPTNTMSPSELWEHQSKAGKAAQEKRRLNKTFKQAMEWALEMNVFKTEDEVINGLKKAYPDMTNRDAMAIAMVNKVLREGDTRAFLAARDTTGELPAQTVNVKNSEPMTITVKTIED